MGSGKFYLRFIVSSLISPSFRTVFFVDGSSKGSFQRDLVRYVRSLGTAHSQKTFDASMAFLAQPINGERLLVIDNVDDPTVDLAPLLPRWSNGAVIVTSRSSSRGQLGLYHLELDVMSLDESVELLVRGSRREWPPSESDKEAAIAVAKELGCHPIALVQAISYMSNTGHSAATYITRLRSYRKPLLNDPATNQVEMRYRTAFAAFDASYEILPPNAQKALRLFSTGKTFVSTLSVLPQRIAFQPARIPICRTEKSSSVGRSV